MSRLSAAGAHELVSILFRIGWSAAGKGKFRIGKDHFDIGALGPFAVAIGTRVLGRDAGFDVRVMHHHPQARLRRPRRRDAVSLSLACLSPTSSRPHAFSSTPAASNPS